MTPRKKYHGWYVSETCEVVEAVVYRTDTKDFYEAESSHVGDEYQKVYLGTDFFWSEVEAIQTALRNANWKRRDLTQSIRALEDRASELRAALAEAEEREAEQRALPTAENEVQE